MNDFRRHLLWVDGSAAAVAGVVVLLIADWLSQWYQLPRALLLWIGLVNLIYACYSISLAMRSHRPLVLIVLLVVANLGWAVICMLIATSFRDTATLFGLAHVIGEGLFVAGLATLEWRWREQLRGT